MDTSHEADAIDGSDSTDPDSSDADVDPIEPEDAAPDIGPDAVVEPCGNGQLELGEQCDPGPDGHPGCSSTCQLTGNFLPEVEINDTAALANALGPAEGFLAAIDPVGDLDHFSFTVPYAGAIISIETSDGVGGCPGFDSKLSLFGPGVLAIVSDDDGGVGTCSKITPELYPQVTDLALGIYVVRVQHGDNATVPRYVLSITVRPPG